MPFNLSPSRGFDTSARARFTNKACRINKALPTRHPNTIQQAPIGGKTGPQRASDETNAKQHEGREGGSILVPPASGPPSGDGSPAGASRPRPHGRASPPPAAVAAAPPTQLLSKTGGVPRPASTLRTCQIDAQGPYLLWLGGSPSSTHDLA